MIPIQLDFFKTQEECENQEIRRIVIEIKESSNKVRRKLFSENGELKKKVSDLEYRLQILERNICNETESKKYFIFGT